MSADLNTINAVGRKKQGYSGPPGLIRQKNSSHWYIKINVNGKAIYKSTKTDDIRKAELILSKVKTALLSIDQEVIQVIGKSIPFGDLIDRYLREVSSGKRSSESDQYRAIPLSQYFQGSEDRHHHDTGRLQIHGLEEREGIGSDRKP